MKELTKKEGTTKVQSRYNLVQLSTTVVLYCTLLYSDCTSIVPFIDLKY